MPYSSDGLYIPSTPEEIRQGVIDKFNELFGTAYTSLSWNATNNQLMTECAVQAISDAEARYSLAYNKLANYIANTEKTLMPLSTNDAIRIRLKELGYDVYFREESLNGGNVKIFVSPESIALTSEDDFKTVLAQVIKERWPAGVAAIQNSVADPKVTVTHSNGQGVDYFYLIATLEPVEIEMAVYTTIGGGEDLPSVEDIKDQLKAAFDASYRMNYRYFLQEIANVNTFPFARSIVISGKPLAAVGELGPFIVSETAGGGALMTLSIDNIDVTISSGAI